MKFLLKTSIQQKKNVYTHRQKCYFKNAYIYIEFIEKMKKKKKQHTTVIREIQLNKYQIALFAPYSIDLDILMTDIHLYLSV